MTTKTEEKLKLILKEFIEQKEKNIDNIIIERTLGIFIWGFIIGALFSYISLLPFFIGLIIGIIIIKKNPFMVNIFIDKFINLINNYFIK